MGETPRRRDHQAEPELELRPELPDVASQLSATSGPEPQPKHPSPGPETRPWRFMWSTPGRLPSTAQADEEAGPAGGLQGPQVWRDPAERRAGAHDNAVWLRTAKA